MKKIIDFFKRLFGFTNNQQNSELKNTEIPITKYGLNGGLSEQNSSQSISKISLLKRHFFVNLCITRKEAKNLYGIINMNKFIYKLRKRGMNIVYNENTKIYTYEPKA